MPPSLTTHTQRSPITLAFLFYMVTFGAIVSACMRPLTHNQTWTTQSLSLLVGIGVGLGLFQGIVLGLFVMRSLLATVIVAGVGVCIGAIAGALALVEPTRFVEIVSIAFVGSWLMIACMAVAAGYQK